MENSLQFSKERTRERYRLYDSKSKNQEKSCRVTQLDFWKGTLRRMEKRGPDVSEARKGSTSIFSDPGPTPRTLQCESKFVLMSDTKDQEIKPIQGSLPLSNQPARQSLKIFIDRSTRPPKEWL